MVESMKANEQVREHFDYVIDECMKGLSERDWRVIERVVANYVTRLGTTQMLRAKYPGLFPERELIR